MKKFDKLLNLILPLITVVCILIIWATCAYFTDNEYLLPSVGATIEEFFALFISAKFYSALLFTLLRSVIAFALSFLVASILAFLSSKSKKGERLILPLISIVRALPTLAIVLLLLIWTNNQVAPVLVTSLVVMPTAYTQIKGAIDSIDKNSVEAGMVDGTDKFSSFFKIELPQIAPIIYSAVGSGLALNLKLMVAAEVMSATVKSLGTILNISNYNGEIAKMLALVLVVLILGLVIEFFFNYLSKKSGDWK